MDTSGTEEGVVVAFQSLIEQVYMPALRKFEGWGALAKSPQGLQTRRDFMESVRRFTYCLSSKSDV